MCDRDQGDLALGALREGLQALHVPEPSPDFDARVLAALHRESASPARWRFNFLPAMVGAAASCALMLLIAQCLLQVPSQAESIRKVAGKVPAGAVEALDRVLDDPTTAPSVLMRMSLCGGWSRVLRDAVSSDSASDEGARRRRSDAGTVSGRLA